MPGQTDLHQIHGGQGLLFVEEAVALLGLLYGIGYSSADGFFSAGGPSLTPEVSVDGDPGKAAPGKFITERLSFVRRIDKLLETGALQGVGSDDFLLAPVEEGTVIVKGDDAGEGACSLGDKEVSRDAPGGRACKEDLLSEITAAVYFGLDLQVQRYILRGWHGGEVEDLASCLLMPVFQTRETALLPRQRLNIACMY